LQEEEEGDRKVTGREEEGIRKGTGRVVGEEWASNGGAMGVQSPVKLPPSGLFSIFPPLASGRGYLV